MNGVAGGLPDLGGGARVAVARWTLLPLSGIDVLEGGLTDPAAVAHLRLVDIPNGRAYLAPVNNRQLDRLKEQAGDILAGPERQS